MALRTQHWREFMEEVLGIPPDTPLTDVLPAVIMKAAKPHYAPLLTEAAVKARSMATATHFQASQLPPGPSPAHGHTRAYQSYSYSRPQPQQQVKTQAVSPEFIRARLEQSIFNMKMPSQLIDHVRFTGHEGTTGSGNFRMDFTNWTFGPSGHPGPLPLTATSMLEGLLRSVAELEAMGVQLMNYSVPFMVRITFRSEYRGRLFERALHTKTQLQSRDSNSCSSNAPVSDQYPPRTSYQEAASALIDSYRPSASSQSDSSNRRLSSSHKPDSRQNPERRPAEALQPTQRLENGRLSPIPDVELQSGVKRERGGSLAAEENMQLPLRPQAKRPRATDFVDMSDDHYP